MLILLLFAGEYDIPPEDMGDYVFNQDHQVTIGEGDTLLSEHFDKIVMSMKESETCYIKSRINADGQKVNEFDSGKPALKFNVILKSFSRAADSCDLEQDERLERGQDHKKRGTELYQKGRIDFAIKRFTAGLEYLQAMEPLDKLPTEMREQQQLLMCQCHLNLAAAFLKREDYEKVVEHCTTALTLQPDNVKGLFRRGQAYTKLNKYENAKVDISHALKLEPENKAVYNQLRTVEGLIQKEKEMYKKMFASWDQVAQLVVGTKTAQDQISCPRAHKEPLPNLPSGLAESGFQKQGCTIKIAIVRVHKL